MKKQNNYCGLDFGTSNSTVGVRLNGEYVLLPLEQSQVTIPSAIFFDFETDGVRFGRDAVNEYIHATPGRLLKGLKSVLGTSLMSEKTQVKRESWSYQDILGLFINHLKATAEVALDDELTRVVIGRPVRFVDDNDEADAKAQHVLEAAARAQGFKEIAFEYEPIAAAFNYEASLAQEKMAFIVDLGGGTSDFALVRLGPERLKCADRSQDILATGGVHVGGNDFDKYLSLAQVMPHLGKDQQLRSGRSMPQWLYHDFSTWHLVNSLYNFKVTNLIKDCRQDAEDKSTLDRLIKAIDKHLGHYLIHQVEQAKIELTHESSSLLGLDRLEQALSVNVSRKAFNESIEHQLRKMMQVVMRTLAMAGKAPCDVDTVFLTGGSASIPSIQSIFKKIFIDAKFIEGDRFGSVGLGLARVAQTI